MFAESRYEVHPFITIADRPLGADGHLDAALFLRRGASRGGRAYRAAGGGGRARLDQRGGQAGRAQLQGAWDGVQALNNLFGGPLIDARRAGGKAGRPASPARGRAVIDAFHKVQAELGDTLARLEAKLAGDGRLEGFFWSLGMKTSARNALQGVVKSVTEARSIRGGAFRRRRGGDHRGRHPPERQELGLAPGKPAIALIKSSFGWSWPRAKGLRWYLGPQPASRRSRPSRGRGGEQRNHHVAGGRQDPHGHHHPQEAR